MFSVVFINFGVGTGIVKQNYALQSEIDLSGLPKRPQSIEIDARGQLLCSLFADPQILLVPPQDWQFIPFGPSRTLPGTPYDFKMDHSGRLLVVGHIQHKVSMWDADGTLLPSFGEDQVDGFPSSVDIDRDGNYIISDSSFVYVFDTVGKFRRKLKGPPNCQLIRIRADLNTGNLVGYDWSGHKIHILSSEDGTWHTLDSQTQVSPYSTQEPGYLYHPSKIDVDGRSNIIVLDVCRIQIITPSGEFRLVLSLPPIPSIHFFSRVGASHESLNSLRSFVLDSEGRILVVHDRKLLILG